MLILAMMMATVTHNGDRFGSPLPFVASVAQIQPWSPHSIGFSFQPQTAQGRQRVLTVVTIVSLLLVSPVSKVQGACSW